MIRIGSLLLMVFLLTITVGNHLYFTIRRSQIRADIKYQIKNGVPESQLFVIRFHANDEPLWTKPGKEFKLGEHMFDIVRTEEGDNFTDYHCINDVQEKQLFSDLDKLTHKRLLGKNKALGASLVNGFNHYLPPASPDTCTELREIPHNLLLGWGYLFPVSSAFQETSTPPPDTV